MPGSDATPPADAPLGAVLAGLSNEMVAVQKKYWGRGPVEAKSYLLDDLLTIVLRGGLTVAEETMLANGHHDEVRAFRQLWQNDMEGLLVSMVQRRLGRRVATYQSQILFDPNIVIEIFVLERERDSRVPASAAGLAGAPVPDPPANGPSDGTVGSASDAALAAPPERSRLDDRGDAYQR
ncbi:DUF2294 domain-containing protein [Patulibacter sp. SYSU D01012]|uniref:DUF2294 domain-containing protein n=1 Tax=Patulibacter sp. SYSU D01012 TaxID=2817381 RepID=UPI001B30E0CA|nr:DUF2294 domain-containing protein [Patulibacter sp. SYSU D01012]